MMKQIQLLLFIAVFFCACSKKKNSIDFVTLSKEEISSLPNKLPDNPTIDSIEQAHNRCMGVAFDANAFLVNMKENAFIGNVVNKNTGKVASHAYQFGINTEKLLSRFSIVTTPCYKKKQFNMSLKSVMGNSFSIDLPGSNKEMGKEITNLMMNSEGAEIETGGWVYMDMQEALKKILDTAKSETAM